MWEKYSYNVISVMIRLNTYHFLNLISSKYINKFLLPSINSILVNLYKCIKYVMNYIIKSSFSDCRTLKAKQHFKRKIRTGFGDSKIRNCLNSPCPTSSENGTYLAWRVRRNSKSREKGNWKDVLEEMPVDSKNIPCCKILLHINR